METKTYLFQPEKIFLKQGFYLTDESDSIIYEVKMLKQPLFGAMPFDFINHLTNKTTSHKVGHTITTEETGLSQILSTKSYCKIDGVKIWDYLHELGIRIDSNLQSNKIGMTYNVTLKGEPMATITSTTPKGKSVMTSKYVYEVITSENNLDLAFLVTFAIARTDQTFYS